MDWRGPPLHLPFLSLLTRICVLTLRFQLWCRPNSLPLERFSPVLVHGPFLRRDGPGWRLAATQHSEMTFPINSTDTFPSASASSPQPVPICYRGRSRGLGSRAPPQTLPLGDSSSIVPSRRNQACLGLATRAGGCRASTSLSAVSYRLRIISRGRQFHHRKRANVA